MPDQDPLKYFGSEVKRLHYYNSQFLVAEDFNDEQLYHNQMRRLHNRSLHTWGVVRGLQVSGTTGATRVVVAPGIAIDRLGREVVLPAQPDPIGLDRFEANSKVYVTIGYADVPVRKNRDEQTTDDYYERLAERPKVDASATAPAADAPEVLLAVLTLDRNKSVAAVDVSARRYAGSRFGSSDDGREFSLYADPAGVWHFYDGVKGNDRLTVDERGSLKITDGDLQLNDGHEIFFKDQGQIRSRDDAHRILFRRNENKLELREFGDIIFSPGATAGSEAVKVTMLANGYVGIGETTPATRLHIAGSGDTELSLQSSDNKRRWTLQASSGTEGTAPAGYFQIIDRTAPASRLTINTSGNVGIGTTDPGTSKLKIVSGTDFAHFQFNGGSGELQFVGWSSGWNINSQTAGKHLYINRDAQNTTDVYIGRAGKELLVKGDTGNVAIRPSTNSAPFPLTFPNELGDKIALWGQTDNHYGFGIQPALLQIYSDTVGADIAFGYGPSASFTETVRFKGNGNVGIGASDSAYRLLVRGAEKLVPLAGEYSNVGDGNATIYSPGTTNVSGVAAGDWVVIPGQTKKRVEEVRPGPGGSVKVTGPGWRVPYNGPLYLVRTADTFRVDDSNSNMRFLIDGDGNVGVGTPSPSAKLHVNGSIYSSNGAGWTWGDRAGGWGGSASNLSILASDSVGGANFRAFSDVRIKEVAGRSDGAADLQTLLNIEVTDYRYRDAASKGGGAHKKVIGQQVERVFPQAVSRHTDVVPDIYRPAPIRDGWVELATDLKRGERVKLITEEGTEGVHEVLEAAGERFRVASMPEAERVFVFGREVDDFLAVDYDAIAMLNVSATQQLKRETDEQLRALQSEVAQLRAANEALSHRLQRLSSGVQTETAVAAKTPNGNGSH